MCEAPAPQPRGSPKLETRSPNHIRIPTFETRTARFSTTLREVLRGALTLASPQGEGFLFGPDGYQTVIFEIPSHRGACNWDNR